MNPTIRCTDPRHDVEYLRVSSGEALLYREHEAEGLTRPGWWYRGEDDAWRGPFPSLIQAKLESGDRAARDFYAGKSFERQAAHDALGEP